MFRQDHLVVILITYTLTFFKMITGTPVVSSSMANPNEQFEVKNETRYPNGTVHGEFSYMDDDGNPINVKYYADEYNYGVELKSAKIIGPGKASIWKSSTYKTIKKPEKLQHMTGKTNGAQYDNKKKIVFKNEKKAADYETFYRNDIKGQCNKDKVRVYLDREKRIIKRALENYQATKSCGRN